MSYCCVCPCVCVCVCVCCCCCVPVPSVSVCAPCLCVRCVCVRLRCPCSRVYPSRNPVSPYIRLPILHSSLVVCVLCVFGGDIRAYSADVSCYARPFTGVSVIPSWPALRISGISRRREAQGRGSAYRSCVVVAILHPHPPPCPHRVPPFLPVFVAYNPPHRYWLAAWAPG